jgi:hypothetical protein
MKRIFLTLSLLLSLILLSCGGSTAPAGKSGGAKGRPAWMDNPGSIYPESQYISALGAGDTRQAAESNASANLTKRFKVQIDVDDTMLRRYESFTKLSGTMSESLSESQQRQVQSRSSETLIDVQFSEIYTDNLGRVNVVAFLDRKKSGDLYAKRIQDNLQSIEVYLANEERTIDIPEKYAYINAALAISQVNEQMLEQLDIISPAHKNRLAVDESRRMATLSEKQQKIAKQIGFSVAIVGDDDQKITIQVQQAISKLGFQLSPQAILTVAGSVDYEALDLRRDNLTFYGWQLDLKLTDPSGKTLISIVERGREGGLDETAAKRNAVRQMSKIIAKRFQKELIDYFDRMLIKR